MPRPNNKTELLYLSTKNFDALISLIKSMSSEDQQKEFPRGTMNRNIRDVLMHLHDWHLMMYDWYTVGMKGEKPAMPTKGYTWKTVPELNKQIWEKNADVLLENAMKNCIMSHEKVMNLIEKHTDEELFEKKRYKWTGTTSLGAYLISATSSHYEWAIKLIKKAKK